jgi:hypothetical protein
MGTESRESIYGSSIRHSAERAKEVRKVADRLACEPWNKRMLGFKGPGQPSPSCVGRETGWVSRRTGHSTLSFAAATRLRPRSLAA